MNKYDYDVIIIGGGIVGIGLFRDMALHGLKCLLLERGDFSSQTSQSSSKMLHGGIRYLENFDFFLVREALYEKNLWIKIAPHLAQEIPFCLPVYKESKYPLFMTSIGLKIYDLLSGFQNKAHSILNKKQTLDILPALKAKDLRGSGIYYDAIVDDHKLALECLYDALLEKKGCEAFNYHQVTAVNDHDINVVDTLTGTNKKFTGREIIYATGPFTDDLLKNKLKQNWTDQMLLTKGSHIWLKHSSLPIAHPIVLQTNDQRVIFIIPQSRGVLVGTTETEVREDIFNIQADAEDIDYLLHNLHEYFPDRPLSKNDILSSFSGVRPLVRQEGRNAHKASRHHKIYHLNDFTHVIIGGKYTTFRVMGAPLTKEILERQGKDYDAQKTLAPLRQHSTVSSYQKGLLNEKILSDIINNERPRTLEDVMVRRVGLPNPAHWEDDESYDAFMKRHAALFEGLHLR